MTKSSSLSTVDISTRNSSAAYFSPATLSKPGVSWVHVAGQVGTTQDGTAPADYESQIHLALLNLKQVLLEAGAAIHDIAKLTLYVVHYDAATRKHVRHVQRFLAGHRPAITLVPVAQLAHPSWLFEVDAVAAVEAPTTTTVPKQLAPPPPPSTSSSATTVDVVIIGAGLAGLAAAEQVQRAGLSCVVLEARDRVGGKTWSEPLSNGDGVVDLGAAWINDSNQSRMIALARRVGAELVVQNTTGQCVLQDFDGQVSDFPYGELPQFDAATVRNVAEIRDMTEADCQALDVWHPNDTSLDALTFEAYLRSRGASPTALATATLWTRAMLGQEPSDVSALFFLHYCKSGGGLMQMRSDRQHGGQYLRVRQGTQVFAQGLAAGLAADTVRLSTAVTAVTQTRDGTMLVHTGTATGAAGAVYTARKAISSVPSPVLKTIAFSPPLPRARQLVVESSTYGYYTKAMMVFRTPFWVARGYCGLTQSFTGPAAIVRDTSVPRDNKHVLTCFLVGAPGRAWSQLAGGEEAQTSALLAQIGRLFSVGADEVRAQFVERRWYEWTDDGFAGGGCPCPSLAPGVLDAVGGSEALRAPVGHVHFVGTETAGEWKGYMEGAVRSGERGAAEVIAQLKGAPARL